MGDEQTGRAGGSARRLTLFVAALAAAILAWALANLALGHGFVVLVSGKLHGEEEAASALARLFAALVLVVFPAGDSARRLGWVAAGLLVFALGNLAFGYLEPLMEGHPTEPAEGLYEALFVRTVACALLVVGLLPENPPRPSLKALGVGVLGLSAIYALVFEVLEWAPYLPSLARGDLGAVASPFERVTAWHWALAAVPVLLAAAATVGALRRSRDGSLPGWLPVAMALLAGSVAHEYLWPSAYGGSELTTADLLRLAFAVAVAVGGVIEMRRIASERATLLDAEKERTRRLEELAALKADFSAMVAHELCGPVAAIRNLAEMVGDKDVEADLRDYARKGLVYETDALDALISDVRAAASVERDDFMVEARPVPLCDLLEGAGIRAVVGDHPTWVLLEELDGSERVLADPWRIGQVLRNLLSNAARYSPEGSPVELRATRRAAGRVRLEVADEGPGIHPDDLRRVFEKFGRGRDREGRKIPGAGLGLYLSRRIVRAHGSELTVRSAPGEGSVFSFELEEVAR